MAARSGGRAPRPARRRPRLRDHERVRTVGRRRRTAGGRPHRPARCRSGPDALEVAARRGEGEDGRAARPCRAWRRAEGRRRLRRPPGARAQGPADRAGHPGLPDAGRRRRGAAVLARPGRRGRGRRRRRTSPPWPPRRSPVEPVADRGGAVRPDARRLRADRAGDAHLRLPRARLRRGRRGGRRRPRPDPGLAAGARPRSPPTRRSGRARTPATPASAPRPGTAGRRPGPTEVFADAGRLPPADRRRARHRHRPRHRDDLFRRPAVGELADRRGAHRRRRRCGSRTPSPSPAWSAGWSRPPPARRATAPRRPTCAAEVLRVAAWRAGRSGLAGDLVHPRTGRPAPAADVLGALLDHVRPALADAGDEQRVDRRASPPCCAAAPAPTCSASVHRETGDLRGRRPRRGGDTAGQTGDRPAARRPAGAPARFRACTPRAGATSSAATCSGPRPDPRDRPYRFVIRLALVVFRLFGFRFDVRGSEHVPATGGAIICSNHVSFFDFTFLGLGALPQHRLVRFMAKSVGLRPLVRRPVHAGHAAHPGRPQGRRRRVRVRGPGARRTARSSASSPRRRSAPASPSRTSRPVRRAWPSTPACRSSRPPSGAGTGSPPRATRWSCAAASPVTVILGEPIVAGAGGEGAVAAAPHPGRHGGAARRGAAHLPRAAGRARRPLVAARPPRRHRADARGGGRRRRRSGPPARSRRAPRPTPLARLKALARRR